MKVLVLGGAGFIGRHAVAALLARQHEVIVGSRHPQRAGKRLGPSAQGCERRQLRFEQMTQAEQWRHCLRDVDAVVNSVGILRERGRETYDAVHRRAPMALAHACREKGIRLVHVSALGLNHPHRSGFLRSKLRAEQALGHSGVDYRLVRPSLLDGDGGYGARWIRWLARLPVHVLPASALGRIAVLHVEDLGEALARLVEIAIVDDAPAEQREFDLGGLQQRDLATYMQAIRLHGIGSPARCLRVPGWLARIGSHLCDVAHFSPFSFGHWELLQQDNIPRCNRLPELLGRLPRVVAAEVKAPAAGPATSPAPTGISAY
ncbi:MAG: NAD(P)H-binding protein [Arenimonas sp.]|jgi:NADH dehydrogenase